MADNNNGGSLLGLIFAIGAAVLSYNRFHSIGWAIVSAVLGLIYLIYYAIRYA